MDNGDIEGDFFGDCSQLLEAVIGRFLFRHNLVNRV
jgi:hypothetical protein